jgi:hypothetical protein
VNAYVPDFEAASANGLLEIVALNTDPKLTAQYSLEISNCTQGILVIPEGVAFTLRANLTTT